MALDPERPARWLIGIAEPSREHLTCERIRDAGILVYLPIEVRQRRAGRNRLREVVKPILGPYFFVPASVTDRDYVTIRYMRGVTGFLEVDGRPAVIRDGELDRIRSEEAYRDEQRRRRLIERGQGDHFMVGEAVQISVGFARMSGVVDAISPTRAKVKLDIVLFGREVVEVDLAHLSPAM